MLKKKNFYVKKKNFFPTHNPTLKTIIKNYEKTVVSLATVSNVFSRIALHTLPLENVGMEKSIITCSIFKIQRSNKNERN